MAAIDGSQHNCTDSARLSPKACTANSWKRPESWRLKRDGGSSCHSIAEVITHPARSAGPQGLTADPLALQPERRICFYLIPQNAKKCHRLSPRGNRRSIGATSCRRFEQLA